MEYALSLVESLAQEYERLVEMREGVRGMAYAYSVSMGPQKEAALSNVKAGFRECTEALCQVETKLQKLLGVFQMEIKGLIYSLIFIVFLILLIGSFRNSRILSSLLW